MYTAWQCHPTHTVEQRELPAGEAWTVSRCCSSRFMAFHPLVFSKLYHSPWSKNRPWTGKPLDYLSKSQRLQTLFDHWNKKAFTPQSYCEKKRQLDERLLIFIFRCSYIVLQSIVKKSIILCAQRQLFFLFNNSFLFYVLILKGSIRLDVSSSFLICKTFFTISPSKRKIPYRRLSQ